MAYIAIENSCWLASREGGEPRNDQDNEPGLYKAWRRLDILVMAHKYQKTCCGGFPESLQRQGSGFLHFK